VPLPCSSPLPPARPCSVMTLDDVEALGLMETIEAA
jgi:hypothetical protein